MTEQTAEELAKLSALGRIKASYRSFLSTLLIACGAGILLGIVSSLLGFHASRDVQVMVPDFVAMSQAIQIADQNTRTLEAIFHQYPDSKAGEPLAEMRAALDAGLKALANVPGGKLDDVSIPSLVTAAHADTLSNITDPTIYRPAIMIFMIVALTLFLLLFMGLYLYTKDADKLRFAGSMIQTIIGFYVGVVTGVLGIPPVK
ncbi:MAG: hypothetical protein EOQ42_24180 [Mesorhizobium sp.]|uniref:hypothetical protein n=1 Tax=unclassified Mesorhizobium TaxID=325217 RepID=UPI000FE8C3EC|nr:MULTISPECIES: hypothetical protein [unclassified Mesorhizobium]RWB30515.1 MAG: hypothetical protein EOQ43_15305 [Mesorhizobium sp.]RWB52714.1 MAG: hypothetical protein EOQ42_24180 [Mesorhizobium sp.]TGT93785.1 hypothetical protein EN807_26350 [Mesorhizobium sp. M5C.F.Ca.ET.164.01.1.1]